MTKFKKWIIGLFLGSAVLAAGFTASDLNQQSVQDKIKALPPGLQLKADLKDHDKKNILESKDVDWIEEVKDKDGKPTGEIKNKGKIKQYAYVSDEEASGFIFTKDRPHFSDVKRIKQENRKTTDRFYSGDQVYKNDKDGKIYKIKEATTSIEAFDLQTQETPIEKTVSYLFGNKVLAACGDSGGDCYAESGGDKTCYSWGRANWDSAHDATAADYIQNNSFELWINVTNYNIERGFLPFDTSSLPDDAIIFSASINLYYFAGDLTQNKDIGVVQTTQSSVTTVGLDDFDQCGAVNNPVEGASRINTSSISSSAYTPIPLNSTGIGWISKTGYTKLGLRFESDLDDIPPSAGHWIKFYNSINGTNLPYLEITYTGGTTPTRRIIEIIK